MFTFETIDDVIWMRLLNDVTPTDEALYLDLLGRVAARQDPFALVSIIDISGGVVTHATRREQNLWFKRNRDQLGRLCWGMARVRPNVDPARNDDAFVRAVPFPTRRLLREEDVPPLLSQWRAAYAESTS
ncbi:MAG: hypothetical protein ACFB13_21315 [Kiloniellaceae bacterium]